MVKYNLKNNNDTNLKTDRVQGLKLHSQYAKLQARLSTSKSLHTFLFEMHNKFARF
jgi:hypothetical protein